ncbi:MAG: hypothetical protein ACRD4B_02485, partial [Acidobacteriota bacterium]
SSLRINLYSWQNDSRDLTQCTLRIHGKDLDTAIDYLKEGGAQGIHDYSRSPAPLRRRRDSGEAVC